VSAFVVDRAHVDYLIGAGLRLGVRHPVAWYDPKTRPRWVVGGDNSDYLERTAAARRELRPDTADRVGGMLWAENHRSVSYRYDEAQATPEYSYTVPYRARRLDPVQVLKAIRCYEYQTCECPDWDETEAWEFCDSLRHAAIAALPGYDAAKWEITEPEGVPA
jgi:hypothetical protein